MKNKNIPSFLLAFTLFVLSASASSYSEHQRVKIAVEGYAHAFASSDADVIEAYLADRHTHINPFGSEISGEDLLEDIRSGRLVFDQYELESYEVTPLNYSFYLATGIVHAHACREGKEMSGRFRFVHVLGNGGLGDDWKSIYTQHTKILSPAPENGDFKTFIDP